MQSEYRGDGEFAEGTAPPERLADRLAEGRLPLDQALGCAADLAMALRELHAGGRAHGAVTPVFVALEPSRAVLLPAPGSAASATPSGDVAAFGALLYEMLVGRKATGSAFAPAIVRSPYGTAWTPVYQSALRVAEKCLAGNPDVLPSFQNIATEVRLLLVVARRPQGASETASLGVRGPVPEFSEDPGSTLTDLICPRCGADDVHISARRSPFEHFLGRFEISFFRCRRCFHRFLLIFGIKIPKKEPA